MSTDALLSDNACAAAPSALTRTRMSTASVDVRDRFAYWNDMVCAAYVPLECERPESCDIVGEIALSRLGPLELTQLHSSVRKVRRTPRLIGRDGRAAFSVIGELDWTGPQARQWIEPLLS